MVVLGREGSRRRPAWDDAGHPGRDVECAPCEVHEPVCDQPRFRDAPSLPKSRSAQYRARAAATSDPPDTLETRSTTLRRPNSFNRRTAPRWNSIARYPPPLRQKASAGSRRPGSGFTARRAAMSPGVTSADTARKGPPRNRAQMMGHQGRHRNRLEVDDDACRHGVSQPDGYTVFAQEPLGDQG